MSKTKWYQKPIYALVALALVLSLAIVAVPMAADSVTPSNFDGWYCVNYEGNFYKSGSPIFTESAVASFDGNEFQLQTLADDEYTDAGVALYTDGSLTIGELSTLAVAGNGDVYAVNLWLDKSDNGEFFVFDESGMMTGLDGDLYGHIATSTNGALTVDDTSIVDLFSGGGTWTLAQLKAGACEGVTSDTKAALWIGISGSDPLSTDIKTIYVNGAPEVSVDDDWVDTNFGDPVDELTFGIDAFATIQNGIDAVAEGGTVNVAAGTYKENVFIDKSLTLQGEDRETTIIQSQLEGGMSGTYGDRVVIIEANNVIVSGFTLSGYTSTEAKSGSTAWPLYADGYDDLEASNNIFTFYTQGGIRFLNGDNMLIKDNIFQRETRSVWYKPAGATPGSYVDRTYGGMGPELWYCTNATIGPNVIETYAVGIFIQGCNGPVSIKDNIVSAPDTTTPSDSGIHIQSSKNITVAGNTVSNFTAGDKAGYTNGTTGAGISILSSNDNVTVERNNLNHNTVGTLVTGASGSPEIHRNNIEDNEAFGVLNCASWVGKDRTCPFPRRSYPVKACLQFLSCGLFGIVLLNSLYQFVVASVCHLNTSFFIFSCVAAQLWRSATSTKRKRGSPSTLRVKGCEPLLFALELYR